MYSVLLLVSTVTFASERVATPIDSIPAREPAATPAPAASAPAAPAPEAPASVAAVRPLLGARHTEDLPTRTALDTHPGAEEALQWLARYGSSLVEAERAAMLLATYDSEATAEVCLSLLTEGGHAKVRAGAARCLATQSAAAAEPALVALLTDSDIRVGIAAADALVLRPGAVERLEPSMVQTLSESVQEHLKPR